MHNALIPCGIIMNPLEYCLGILKARYWQPFTGIGHHKVDDTHLAVWCANNNAHLSVNSQQGLIHDDFLPVRVKRLTISP